MKKKVFISGGAGVIGTSLVNLLIRKKNYEIFVGDIKDKPQEFKNKILYRKGDLNFLKEDEIRNFQPEIFIHLAAVFERTDESYNFYDNNFRNNIALSNHLLKLIAKINSALQRIKEGTYGFCEETGEPIGLKRLIARPVATLSIEAQERHERDEKIFIDD